MEPISKADLKNRCIPVPVSRHWKAEFFEHQGRVFCYRGPKDGSFQEVLELKLGPHPVLGIVMVYWDKAEE